MIYLQSCILLGCILLGCFCRRFIFKVAFMILFCWVALCRLCWFAGLQMSQSLIVDTLRKCRNRATSQSSILFVIVLIVNTCEAIYLQRYDLPLFFLRFCRVLEKGYFFSGRRTGPWLWATRCRWSWFITMPMPMKLWFEKLWIILNLCIMSIFLTPIFKVGDDFILLSCIYDLSLAKQNIIFKVADDLRSNHRRICLGPGATEFASNDRRICFSHNRTTEGFASNHRRICLEPQIVLICVRTPYFFFAKF